MFLCFRGTCFRNCRGSFFVEGIPSTGLVLGDCLHEIDCWQRAVYITNLLFTLKHRGKPALGFYSKIMIFSVESTQALTYGGLMHPLLGLMKACLVFLKALFRPDALFFKPSGLLKLQYALKNTRAP